MYGHDDTGLGAAIANPFTRQMIRAWTHRKAPAKKKQQTPKPSILPRSFPPRTFAPVKPMVLPVLKLPMRPSIAPPQPSMPFFTAGSGKSGFAPSEDTGDAPEVDTAKLRTVLGLSPIVLVGVGAVVLFMLRKKGR